MARVTSRLAAWATALAVLCVAGIGAAGAVPASASTTASAPAPPDILTAPTLVASTAAGDVGYREVGSGSPVLLVMGFSGSMDFWAPSFVDALAARHTVIVFDNAGIGDTAALPGTLTISGMARQTSALISALHLRRTAVLGWSMGGMIAQALAVLHPRQVSRLILASTQAGTGASLPIPAAAQAALANPATALSVLFPADQAAAARAYAEGIVSYPGFYGASDAVQAQQTAAIQQWMAGQDPAGRRLSRIHAPALVADGTQDQLDPVQNDWLLTRDIPRAHLILYPDAGHAFLFQDTAGFVPVADRFLR
ncbi:MAG TPA: alpha/beta hydrolase [Trebonia sp.]|jgi:pimeloyl-ACP methyl ester carboxylesterase|nr:alpha/beta hydrolase [Trebonia sp.]